MAFNLADIETIRYYVVPLAEEYGAAKVSLFGSFARGDSQEASDVDIPFQDSCSGASFMRIWSGYVVT